MSKCKILKDERYEKEFKKIFTKSKQAKISCLENIVSWKTKLEMLGTNLVKDEISKGRKRGMIETINASEYLYSLKIKKCKDKNIRILFSFFDSCSLIIFLTVFEEKTTGSDYHTPQKRAEERIEMYQKDGYVPCKKKGGG